MKLKVTGKKCEICGKAIKPHFAHCEGDEVELIKPKRGAIYYVHTDCYRKQRRGGKTNNTERTDTNET